MFDFRFKAGQSVNLVPLLQNYSRKSDQAGHLGPFTVVRRLPSDTHQRSYRVKHDDDGHERVVDEGELRLIA